MAEPAIALNAVDVTFGTSDGPVNALRDVTFTCERGSSVAVVGRSGSGKSTLMSVLALLRRPTSGSVHVDGIDAATLTDRETARLRAEHVGVVFQSFHLEPSLVAQENVLLPWRFSDQHGARTRRDALVRARDLLDSLGVGDLARRPVGAMSGGQRQRVAIARALMSAPTVLVADEPTGNLDEETANAVADVLFRLPGTHGTSTVVVTHDLDVAARADRTVTLTQGELVGADA